MKIVGFGASSMQGVGDPEGGLMRRLDRKLRASGTPAEVVNLGVGGNTTVQMLARLPEAQKQLPATVVVLLGCNDVPRDNDPEPHRRVDLPTYTHNLRQILTALRGPHNLFISSFAVSTKKRGVRDEVLGAYMASATALARELGYHVWDLHTESLAWNCRYLADDGMHFGPEGHELLATRVLEWLRPSTTPNASKT